MFLFSKRLAGPRKLFCVRRRLGIFLVFACFVFFCLFVGWLGWFVCLFVCLFVWLLNSHVCPSLFGLWRELIFISRNPLIGYYVKDFVGSLQQSYVLHGRY